MTLMILGLLVWSVVHFVPTLGLSFKNDVIEKYGEKTYMAVFSILIVLSLVMIVFGWRSTIPEFVYVLPLSTKPIAMLLIVVAFILFGAAKHATRIKQFVRHPQLSSVIVWAAAHLMLNGDSRSIVLFGGLAIWAMIEIVLINRREGAWLKPDVPSWKQEFVGLGISTVMIVVVVFLHPYIAGVPIR